MLNSLGSGPSAASSTVGSIHNSDGLKHTCSIQIGRLSRSSSSWDSSRPHQSTSSQALRSLRQQSKHEHTRHNRCLTRLASLPGSGDAAASRGTEQDGPSTSGRDQTSSSYSHLPKKMVAAMALSPLAALSLPLVQSPSWQQSMHEFGERLRAHARASLNSDGFKQWAASTDDHLTFMDWSYQVFGIDLSYVWDPELWVRFKEAVANDTPALFWNKLWDRIEYRNKLPAAGLVGDMRISYAKFLQLLEAHRIKRVIVYGDMRTAVVEVPHPAYASVAGVPGTYPFMPNAAGEPASLVVPNPLALDDPSQWFAPEMPEWNMEKYRFYVDLPGDFWDSGRMLDYLRSRYTRVHWDSESRQYFVPYEYFTKVQEVRTELQVMDPRESWDFMAWISDQRKLDFYEKAAALCLAVRGTSILVNLVTSTALFKLWRKKTKKKSKQEGMWERLTTHTAREFMSRDPKTGKLRDTGVRFADIAGMDDIVFEMREVVKMMLGDATYKKVGAKAPRGIIFQGPPGTGKTYLARAIAGEAGLTFLSAVGSEFVEMFAGVAAARVNSLYHTARKKAPCIIFIDEMDAIGRSRTQLGGDPGSIERESALLSMLVQMDGINGKLEQVLTIGATNLAQDLDQALLRPGRFEVVYEIPAPGPVARMEILKYHSRNKQLDGDGMLKKVAEVTQGWSAASLANLMNEAAIMTVRKNTDKITLPIVLEIIDNMNFGPQYRKIPPSEAKNRLALVTAAKAVALALTPGIEVIKYVTMWSKKRGLGPYVEFIDSTDNLDPDWHPEQIEVFDFATNIKVNAAEIGSERLGEFLHVASLLQPLYAGRALELEMFGSDQASLATAAPIADCFEIAYYCVRNSMLHPKFRRMPPLHTYIWLGEDDNGHQQRDPLALGLDEELGYHKLTLTLLKAAWRRTTKMVKERRTAIVKVAEALLESEEETVSGSRLVQIIESTPLDDSSEVELGNQFLPILREVLAKVPNVVLLGEQQEQQQQQQQQQQSTLSCNVARATFPGAGRTGQVAFSRPPAPEAAAELVLDDETLATVSRAIMGRLDVVDLVGRNTAYEVAERVRDALLDPQTTERLKAVRRYVEQQNGEFPPPPLEQDIPVPVYGAIHRDLEWWKQRRFNVVTWSALDMLFTERQLKYYRQDADIPRPEDTTNGRKRAAEEQAAAAEKGGTSQ